MTGLLIAALICVALAVALLYRVFKGPTIADRVCAADGIDLLVAAALVLFSLYTGRAIYLDIAIIEALLGFVGTVFVSRYLEGKV